MRAILTLLLLPFLATLFLVGSLLSGFSALLTPARTLAVIEQSSAIPPLYRYGLDSFAKTSEGEGSENPIGLDHPTFARLIDAVIPPEQVTAWLDAGIPAFYTWMDSNQPNLAIPFDLTRVKARIGPAVYAVLGERAATVTTCTAEARSKVAQGEISLCRLPGETDAALLERVRASGMVEQFVAKFPDTLHVPNFTPVGAALGAATVTDGTGNSDAGLLRLRTVYQQRTAILVSVWLVVGFLLLLQVLIHRSQHRRLIRWLGLTLLVVGVLPLLLGIVGVSGTLTSVLQAKLPETLPADARAALTRLIDALVFEVLRLPLLFGALAVISGMLGTVLSLLHFHPHGATKKEDRG